MLLELLHSCYVLLYAVYGNGSAHTPTGSQGARAAIADTHLCITAAKPSRSSAAMISASALNQPIEAHARVSMLKTFTRKLCDCQRNEIFEV